MHYLLSTHEDTKSVMKGPSVVVAIVALLAAHAGRTKQRGRAVTSLTLCVLSLDYPL